MDSLYSAFTNAERATLENQQLQNELGMQPLRQKQAEAQLGALQALTAGRQLDQKIQQEEYDRATQGRASIAEGLKTLSPVDKSKSFSEQQQALTDQLATLQNLAGVAAQSNLPGEATRIQNQAQALQKQLTSAALQRNESLLSAATVAKAGGAKSWQQFVDSIPTLFPEHSQAVLVAGPALRDPNSEVSKAVLGNLQADVLGRKEQMKLAGEADDREEAKRSTRAKEQFEARRVNVAERQIRLAEQKAREERAAGAGSGGGGQPAAAGGRTPPPGFIDPYAGQPRDEQGNVIAKTTSGETYKIPPDEQYFMDKKGSILRYPGGQVARAQTSIPDSRTQAALGAMRQATAQFKQILQLPAGTNSGIWGGMKPESMLAQPLGALANTFTKSGTQQYNALAAGILPDTATAERLGFNVTEAQLKKMQDKFTWREGDDPTTRLRKAAEFRVVLETAAKNVLNNRSITYENRYFAQDTLDTLKKIIPFTNEDITEYEKRNGKSKGKTVGDSFKDVVPKKTGEAQAAEFFKKIGM